MIKKQIQINVPACVLVRQDNVVILEMGDIENSGSGFSRSEMTAEAAVNLAHALLWAAKAAKI